MVRMIWRIELGLSALRYSVRTTPRCIGRSSAAARSFRGQFSVDFTPNIAESDFRYSQACNCGFGRRPVVTELSNYRFSTLREGELTLYRGSGGGMGPALLAPPLSEQPRLEVLKRLEHEYALRADLDSGWAARPLALTHRHNRMALVLEDPGGEPLD